ncbi:MAG: hypothetical protein PHG29_08860 [Prolixibacteraceae bacterium]|jgi:hypothetical protein|nr:hypothetical protein [Prolixibacteraceae bacterium]NLO02748.1 hypothetical protein [Bacteroidales bacterium]
MTKAGKIITILLWIIIIISAVLVVSLMANISENQADPTMGGWINTNLFWAYILLIFGAGVAILFALFHMVTDIHAAKKGLMAFVFLGAVLLIAYLLASDEIPQFIGVQKYIDNGTLTPMVAKWVDTGLYLTYILLGLAIISIVFSSISRIFK